MRLQSPKSLSAYTGRAQFGHPEVPLGAVPLYTPLKDIVGAGWWLFAEHDDVFAAGLTIRWPTSQEGP